MNILAWERFLKYVLTSSSTFAFDLGLLFLLVDVFGLGQVWSAGLAFVVAVSINYFLSRRFVFKGTLRSLKGGYAGFIMIALIGLLIVTGGMFLFLEYTDVHYLVARIAIAGVAGLWNYFMNLYVNFKVAGKHVKN
jgi:putative flippase GtrA